VVFFRYLESSILFYQMLGAAPASTNHAKYKSGYTITQVNRFIWHDFITAQIRVKEKNNGRWCDGGDDGEGGDEPPR